MTYAKALPWADDFVCRSGVAGFCGETLINTLQSDMAARDIRVGNRVISRKGALAVRHVVHETHELVQVVRIKANAFGVGLPLQDVVVGADTRIRLSGLGAQARNLPDGTIISARSVVDGTSIVQESQLGGLLVCLTFDDPAMVYASGLPVACQTDARA